MTYHVVSFAESHPTRERTSSASKSVKDSPGGVVAPRSSLRLGLVRLRHGVHVVDGRCPTPRERVQTRPDLGFVAETETRVCHRRRLEHGARAAGYHGLLATGRGLRDRAARRVRDFLLRSEH